MFKIVLKLFEAYVRLFGSSNLLYYAPLAGRFVRIYGPCDRGMWVRALSWNGRPICPCGCNMRPFTGGKQQQLFFFPQQRKLMGFSAQISSGACRCGS